MSEFQNAYDELSRRDKESKTPFELIEDAVDAAHPRFNELHLPARQLGRGALHPIRSFVKNANPPLVMRVDGGEIVYAYQHEEEGLSVPTAIAYYAALWPEREEVAGYKIEKTFSASPQEHRASLTKTLNLHACGDGLYVQYGEPEPMVPQPTEETVMSWQWTHDPAPYSTSPTRKAYITLEGDVLIPGVRQYLKHSGARLLKSTSLNEPQIVELPESLRTFELELPLTTKRVIKKEGRLLAVMQQDRHPLEATPLSELQKIYARHRHHSMTLGIQFLSLPGIQSNELHEVVASKQNFEDVTDRVLAATQGFMPRPYPNFDSRTLSPAAKEAIESILDDQSAGVKAKAVGALGVAKFLKDALPLNTPLSREG